MSLRLCVSLLGFSVSLRLCVSLLALLVLPLFFSLVGCGASEDVQSLNDVPGREPVIIQQDLNAQQLADILDVEAWTWTFRGPPPECWIEIEEVGQDTMPSRIPDQGGFGSEIDPASRGPQEGNILLYWRRTEPGGGGVLSFQVDGRGTYFFGLNDQAFTLGWRENWASEFDPPKRAGRPIEASPGKELTLLTYQASQLPEGGGMIEQGSPRLTLRLKARFPNPSASASATPSPDPESPTDKESP